MQSINHTTTTRSFVRSFERIDHRPTARPNATPTRRRDDATDLDPPTRATHADGAATTTTETTLDDDE